MAEQEKKTVLSGIQPSGSPTLGNYVGALKNWKLLQTDDRLCYYCVANLHAITVKQDPDVLRENTLSLTALLLACGVDPKESVIFVQSDVKEHCELSWVLNCATYMGELNRMTQFKDKSAKHADNINAGLFTYPVLMAADILLYQADLVPVGADQKQHIEITRDIGSRFNNIYGDVFTLPDGFIPKAAARIKSLQDPTKKMSKSDDNVNSWIAILDSRDDIIRKFKRAVTDSDSRVIMSEDKPGVSNLITIYSAVTGKTVAEIEREFEGRGYGEFKLAVGEAVADELAPIKQKHDEIIKDKGEIERLYNAGAQKAEYTARRTYLKAMKKVGFVL